MDEQEFQRLLDLFPVVRSRDYQAESDSSRQSTSQAERELEEWQEAWDEGHEEETKIQGTDLNEAFWEKLKLAASTKVGAAEAERFCKNFQRLHKKLVYEELSLDAARNLISSPKHSEDR